MKRVSKQQDDTSATTATASETSLCVTYPLLLAALDNSCDKMFGKYHTKKVLSCFGFEPHEKSQPPLSFEMILHYYAQMLNHLRQQTKSTYVRALNDAKVCQHLQTMEDLRLLQPNDPDTSQRVRYQLQSKSESVECKAKQVHIEQWQQQIEKLDQRIAYMKNTNDKLRKQLQAL